jgi:TRAP-type C4-dicarboxylate transport system permease small subunit
MPKLRGETMKKGWISIVGGLILGLIISFFTLEYKGWQYIRHNSNGEVEQVINELDFNLITNSFLIIVATGIVIYLILSIIEKRKKEV